MMSDKGKEETKDSKNTNCSQSMENIQQQDQIELSEKNTNKEIEKDKMTNALLPSKSAQTSTISPLTDEQRKKIEENRQRALRLRKARQEEREQENKKKLLKTDSEIEVISSSSSKYSSGSIYASVSIEKNKEIQKEEGEGGYNEQANNSKKSNFHSKDKSSSSVIEADKNNYDNKKRKITTLVENEGGFCNQEDYEIEESEEEQPKNKRANNNSTELEINKKNKKVGIDQDENNEEHHANTNRNRRESHHPLIDRNIRSDVCEICNAISIIQQYREVFQICICSKCKRTNPEYELVTKSQASQIYLIQNDALQYIPHIEQQSSSSTAPSFYNPVKLYCRKILIQKAIERWGSLDGLEEERSRRKKKKYDLAIKKTTNVFKK